MSGLVRGKFSFTRKFTTAQLPGAEIPMNMDVSGIEDGELRSQITRKQTLCINNMSGGIFKK